MSGKKEWGLRHIIMELRFNATEDTLFQRISLKRLEDLEKKISDRIKHYKLLQKSTYYPDYYEDTIGALKNVLGNVPYFECFGEMTKNTLTMCKNNCEAYNWCRRVTNRSIINPQNILLDSDRSACDCAFCNR